MSEFITEVDILDESKECFLTFAEEVLTDRAIPSAEDGLLSAQRKILWTMEDYLKMDHKSKTKKCQALVGSTLATSYFHGDASCYGVLRKMSQEFLMRYPLIIGQGSLGTQESNDMFASSRYTEAKPSVYADLMMNDFKKNVIPMKETYNNEFYEPVVLPALFPNALCNGRQAIGVSMATNSVPHNLTEVCDAIIAYIEAKGNITVEELMKYVPGPDFPLGGTIINSKDILTAYRTGKSNTSLKIRGDYEIDEKKRTITFTTIPYRTYRSNIREQLNKNIDEVDKIFADFNDESSIGKNKLVFTVNKDVSFDTALYFLFNNTDLQTSVSLNMNFIVNGTPKLCSLFDLVKIYCEHQEQVLLKATEYDKIKAEHKKHILEGLLAAIKNIDEVITLIRNADDRKDARVKLIKLLSIDEEQANAILDMKLAKLTKLDKEDLLNDLHTQEAIIEECNRIITVKDHRDSVLIAKIAEMRFKYGDERRTKLENIEIPKPSKEKPLIEEKEVVVILTSNGKIYRKDKNKYKASTRAAKGTKNIGSSVISTISLKNTEQVFLFSSLGKMYHIVTNNLTEQEELLGNYFNLEPNEEIKVMTTCDTMDFITFVTKKGMIKKLDMTVLKGLEKSSKTGSKCISLADKDELVNVLLTKADERVILFSKTGFAIHFSLTEVAPMGKIARGVKAMKLEDDDEVVSTITTDTKECMVITKGGLGFKCDISEFGLQKRAGKGIKAARNEIVGVINVEDGDNVLITGEHKTKVIAAKEVGKIQRGGLGVKVFAHDEKINSIARL